MDKTIVKVKLTAYQMLLLDVLLRKEVEKRQTKGIESEDLTSLSHLHSLIENADEIILKSVSLGK